MKITTGGHVSRPLVVVSSIKYTEFSFNAPYNVQNKRKLAPKEVAAQLPPLSVQSYTFLSKQLEANISQKL